ncbi:hypothetical protein ACQEVF_56950 [Nonomuraea polychroma]|uniref:hypothetical protein n=1 Tax=Nonomuraea polychroma TaxID=46176 RepID=UPI003D8D914F
MKQEFTPPHHMAQATRRSAALYRHWAAGDKQGLSAVLEEIQDDNRDGWTHLVFGLLNLGSHMVEAATSGGDVDRYLEYVLRQSTFDEATTSSRERP